MRGRYLARAGEEAGAEAERLEREATEARLAGGREAARRQRAAEQARERVQELERFDAALARLLQPGHQASQAAGGWLEQKVAEVSAQGYAPNLDHGVLVNITPLREAGVLHPAADRVT